MLNKINGISLFDRVLDPLKRIVLTRESGTFHIKKRDFEVGECLEQLNVMRSTPEDGDSSQNEWAPVPVTPPRPTMADQLQPAVSVS